MSFSCSDLDPCTGDIRAGTFMSSKGRLKAYTPPPSEFYSTPPSVLVKLREHINFPSDFTYLEPCAGSGAVSRAIPGNWTLLELREEEKPTLEALGHEVICPQDFLTWDAEGREWDYIITNPPFSLAQEFIEKSLTLSPRVIFLLRLSFLESQKRYDFWQKHNPSIYVLSKRPSFVGGATDSCAYAWFFFGSPNPGTWKVI